MLDLDLTGRAGDRTPELEHALGRLGEAMSASPLGMARMGLDGTFLSVNAALCAFLGRTPEELVGRRAREFSHPDDRDATTSAADMIAAGKLSSHQEEKRYLRPDGTTVWALLSISLVRDGEGRPDHHLSFMGDITHHKETEQALRESEADLLTIARVARELSSSADVRAAICEAAIEIAGAAAGFFVEPDGPEELVLTRRIGVDLPEVRLRLHDGEPSGSATAFLTRRPLFIKDAKSNTGASQTLAHALDAGSVMYQPIVSEGDAVGVLIVMWHERLEQPTPRALAALSLLADEASLALEREKLLWRLADQAREDDLTGLPNRRAWNERLPIELSRSQRDEAPCAVALIDLDRFKLYNDEHGHLHGDQFLRDVAQAWRGALRPSDFLARYGGEEFTLLLPNCDTEGARQTVRRIAAAVPDGQTCSIGIARWDGIEPADVLMDRADQALYQAKRLGRNRVETAEPRAVSQAARPGG